LIGRSARQGDPGRVERYISTDDEVIRRFLPKPLALMWRMVFPLTSLCPWLAYRLVRIAQSRAEALALRQRGQSLKAETDMEKGMV
jgi:preprotein translocase subunit SecA